MEGLRTFGQYYLQAFTSTLTTCTERPHEETLAIKMNVKRCLARQQMTNVDRIRLKNNAMRAVLGRQNPLMNIISIFVSTEMISQSI